MNDLRHRMCLAPRAKSLCSFGQFRCPAGRTALLGDFHVRMAELMGNEVLAQMLGDLISRCALITLMYQSASAAEHSHEEHADIVAALAARDEERAVALMQSHLEHVEASLTFDRKRPASDLAAALAS